MKNIQPEHKVLVAYHAHCIDGFTSAWACWRGLIETTSVRSSNIELMPVTYGKELDEILNRASEFYKIYFVDFSVRPDILDSLTEHSKVAVIDHHKSGVEMYADFLDTTPEAMCVGYHMVEDAEVTMDLGECGASLVWKYFYGNTIKMPKLIGYVKDYDLWKFLLADTKAINKYLRLQEKSTSRWNELDDMFKDSWELETLVNEGHAMLNYHDSIVADLVFQAEPVTIAGQKGMVVNCSPQFSSDVGDLLAKVSRTFGATWQQEPEGVVKWSLRSQDDYDVSLIANIFGGGGHKNAAGFTLNSPDYDHKKGITLWAE